MNLTVDIGNSRIKLGFFKDRKLTNELAVSSWNEVEKFDFERSIVSSTAESDLPEFLNQSVQLSNVKSYPIEFDYRTFETLGQDRIANACATIGLEETAHLIIDVGTCVTYDLVVDGVFLGGAISPGCEMRFKAMNNFTSNLPLTQLDDQVTFPGKSTNANLRVGVFEGIVGEMKQFIALSEDNFQELKVILTGGNYAPFAKALKSSIFADPNLTLRGLNEILLHLSN